MSSARADRLTISLAALQDAASVQDVWRDLEARADASFFQSWTWVGCQAEQRYSSPVLLMARDADRVVALALLNRRRLWLQSETLWLGESGAPTRDDVFVEHNGPLIDRNVAVGIGRDLAGALLAAPIAPRRRPSGRRLMLSGIDTALREVVEHTRAYVRVLDVSTAPRVVFATLTGGYLDALSPNTRYQIRRSARRYEARGPLSVDRAEDLATAHLYLDALIVLHQRTWTRRDKPGAFANPHFASFHRELVDRGLPRGEIDLLRIRAGMDCIGYLYNFRYRNRVYAYQSGFDYEGLGPHHKPGLTSHHLAIERYRSSGSLSYDFLAGASRYKTSMANAEETLHWLDVTPAGSLAGRFRAARDGLRRVTRGHAETGSASEEGDRG